MTSCVAAIEIGGTNVIVTAASLNGKMAAPLRLSTSSPETTVREILEALQSLRGAGWSFDALGVASFGPIGVSSGHQNYGRILSTPKPGWSGVSLAEGFAPLGVPMIFETDVNAAALGEGAKGAARGLTDFAYVTCGTGIGVGLCVGGTPVHGRLHPEGGHIRPMRIGDDTFPGVCPWHRDCVEGLASGPAIAGRLGAKPESAADDHPVWTIAGEYIGQMLANVALFTSAQRIILGGGVGSRPEVIAAARTTVGHYLSGYLDSAGVVDTETFIAPPELAHSGLVGAAHLAQTLLANGT